ncbi:hypothetical protein A2154_01205 [Candidatus Gottesmanbacteria bacterium RBG_16_43_7]|uniref:Uncharacterized protein n=1 Tax=Candidatus Gottesmanbacteria bacterium RBG_16_43_7 TaxID=1798373 RepID=A0A1F5ZB64_9BACT|nr:MAG: hypothetical protein A2154_01205 [Candidatus Gottesmanbacteria bacterium RBG_16_43_7]
MNVWAVLFYHAGAIEQPQCDKTEIIFLYCILWGNGVRHVRKVCFYGRDILGAEAAGVPNPDLALLGKIYLWPVY